MNTLTKIGAACMGLGTLLFMAQPMGSPEPYSLGAAVILLALGFVILEKTLYVPREAWDSN